MIRSTPFIMGCLLFGAMSMAPLPSRAGSTTEPGFTTGIPLYTTQLPTGLYMDLVPDVSVRTTSPTTYFEALSPFLTLQTPWRVLNGKLLFVAAPVYANLDIRNTAHAHGFYNTYLGSQINWDLGRNWGVGVRLAGWVPQAGQIANRYGTIAPRVGVTYLSPAQHFTASFERGFTTTENGRSTAPNYANLDLTYTRTWNKFEYGAVSFLSTDTGNPYSGYRQQSQAAVGPLIGYTFGKIQVQAKFTTDVYEHNYRGHEKRAEFNIYIPLWTPTDPLATRIPDR